MAILQLEDPFEKVDAVMFPKVYAENYEALNEDQLLFVESVNTITNQGETLWAQKVLDSYCCEEKIKHRDALMLVGDVR